VVIVSIGYWQLAIVHWSFSGKKPMGNEQLPIANGNDHHGPKPNLLGTGSGHAGDTVTP